MQADPVMCRLDRFLCSTSWLDLFSDSIQRALLRPISDHFPLLLETGMEDWGPPFRFEIMWLVEHGFLDCVRKWWAAKPGRGWIGFQLAQNLKFLKKKMLEWKKETFLEV